MSNQSYQTTKGKQEILYGKATPAQILLITALFFLNVALVFVTDCLFLHTIPRDEVKLPALEAHVPGSVLSTRQAGRGWLILYRTPQDEVYIAEASDNVLGRYRLDPDTARITEEPYVYDSLLLDFTVEGGQITSASRISLLSSRVEAGALIGLCFLMTVLERLLLQKLRGQ